MANTIDVAIPCYKYGAFLTECVESVLSQENVEVRVLILDDCSPDDTEEVGKALADRYPQVEFRRHAVNIGHIATYNEGIEWASAELFLLLSADDYLLPGALARAAELMTAVPDMSFAFGNAVMLSDDGKQVESNPLGSDPGAIPTILSCTEFVRRMKGRNNVPTPTAVIRTSAQKRVGGYNRDLPHAGDLAMWLLLAAEGPIGFVNTPQAVYRIHSQNMSRAYSSTRLPDIQQRYAAVEHFLARSGNRLPDTKSLRATLMKDLARESASHACSAFNDGDVQISLELERLARHLHKGVWRTIPGLRILSRRAMGQRAWQVVRSLANGYRNRDLKRAVFR